MTFWEGIAVFATGGALTKLAEVVVAWLLGRRRAQAEAENLEAKTGHEVVVAAGEVVQHYKSLVEQLNRDVLALKQEVSLLRRELDDERKLRLDLELTLAALQGD